MISQNKKEGYLFILSISVFINYSIYSILYIIYINKGIAYNSYNSSKMICY